VRLARRSLALRPAHSRGHLYVTRYTEGFSHFVTSMTAPVASGWSGRRVGLAPTGKRRLLTAHAINGRWRTVPRTDQFGSERVLEVGPPEGAVSGSGLRFRVWVAPISGHSRMALGRANSRRGRCRRIPGKWPPKPLPAAHAGRGGTRRTVPLGKARLEVPASPKQLRWRRLISRTPTTIGPF
jgi:hypothetical protein